jgi:hypothetical protein
MNTTAKIAQRLFMTEHHTGQARGVTAKARKVCHEREIAAPQTLHTMNAERAQLLGRSAA